MKEETLDKIVEILKDEELSKWDCNVISNIIARQPSVKGCLLIYTDDIKDSVVKSDAIESITDVDDINTVINTVAKDIGIGDIIEIHEERIWDEIDNRVETDTKYAIRRLEKKGLIHVNNKKHDDE